MQTLYNHLINEAAGNSSLCVGRLPTRIRTCDHDLGARKLDWILKLRDHPSGERMIQIAMYVDDLELLVESIGIGARLFVYSTPPTPIGPLVTRHLLEVGLIDKSGTDFATELASSLRISCAKHQLFDLLEKLFPKPIDAVTANRLWRVCPLPSMREWLGDFPYVFNEHDIYAEEHVRQGLDHVAGLILQHSLYRVNLPRLVRAFLEINDRDSIERLLHSSHPKKNNMMEWTVFETSLDGDFCINLTYWHYLPLEDWKWLWELMDVCQRNATQNAFIRVCTLPVADWLLSVGCTKVFITDPEVDVEWKRGNGVEPNFHYYDNPSCALVEASGSVNPVDELPCLMTRSASTQTLMYMKENGLKLPAIIRRATEDLDCYAEWINSHYERVSDFSMYSRPTTIEQINT